MKQTIQKILTDYIQILSDLYKLNYIYTPKIQYIIMLLNYTQMLYK